MWEINKLAIVGTAVGKRDEYRNSITPAIIKRVKQASKVLDYENVVYKYISWDKVMVRLIRSKPVTSSKCLSINLVLLL